MISRKMVCEPPLVNLSPNLYIFPRLGNSRLSFSPKPDAVASKSNLPLPKGGSDPEAAFFQEYVSVGGGGSGRGGGGSAVETMARSHASTNGSNFPGVQPLVEFFDETAAASAAAAASSVIHSPGKTNESVPAANSSLLSSVDAATDTSVDAGESPHASWPGSSTGEANEIDRIGSSCSIVSGTF